MKLPRLARRLLELDNPLEPGPDFPGTIERREGGPRLGGGGRDGGLSDGGEGAQAWGGIGGRHRQRDGGGRGGGLRDRWRWGRGLRVWLRSDRCGHPRPAEHDPRPSHRHRGWQCDVAALEMDDRVALALDDHRRVRAQILEPEPAVGEWLDPQLVARHRLVAGDHAAEDLPLRPPAELQRSGRMLELCPHGGVGDFDGEGHGGLRDGQASTGRTTSPSRSVRR